jgi:Na+-translocating ferredoxin:NAD+ oxidoreductase RnfC subunit
MKRLDIIKYDAKTPFVNTVPNINEVKIVLKQHVGTAAVPFVTNGDFVKEGDLIAEINEGQLGAKLHASISGTVSKVTNEFILIVK